MPEERPEYLLEEHLEYLDMLRESGATNMFGAASYIQDEYPDINWFQAKKILLYWMHTFGARQDQAEEGELYGFAPCIDWSQFTQEEKRLIKCLPHGGGINMDWHVENNSANKIVCHNSFQVMNEFGYCIGWADFSVRFKAEALDKFRLMFHGNRARYLARYYHLRDAIEGTVAMCFAALGQIILMA